MALAFPIEAPEIQREELARIFAQLGGDRPEAERLAIEAALQYGLDTFEPWGDILAMIRGAGIDAPADPEADIRGRLKMAHRAGLLRYREHPPERFKAAAEESSSGGPASQGSGAIPGLTSAGGLVPAPSVPLPITREVQPEHVEGVAVAVLLTWNQAEFLEELEGLLSDWHGLPCDGADVVALLLGAAYGLGIRATEKAGRPIGRREYTRMLLELAELAGTAPELRVTGGPEPPPEGAA